MKSSALILLVAVLATGCVRVDIGDNLPTLGEQLQDLDNAKELGLVDEEEFRKLRKQLITRLIR